MRLVAALLALAGVLSSAPAAAQTSSPPGPWVVDLRGATSGLPKDTAFFPGIPVDTLVPARGFGLDVGGHVYVLTLGPTRVGVGANYLRVRGTTEGVAVTFSTLAPQVSFNFGSRDGWSHLSAGLGRASVHPSVSLETPTDAETVNGLTSINVGGGARWFLSNRLGFAFDVRFHRLSGPQASTLVSASVGLSVR